MPIELSPQQEYGAMIRRKLYPLTDATAAHYFAVNDANRHRARIDTAASIYESALRNQKNVYDQVYNALYPLMLYELGFTEETSAMLAHVRATRAAAARDVYVKEAEDQLNSALLKAENYYLSIGGPQ